MRHFIKNAKNFLRDENGATMVEYGLMVALIAVVCIAAVTLLGNTLSSLFGGVNTSVGAATPKSS